MYTLRRLAAEYGVSHVTIGRVVRDRRKPVKATFTHPERIKIRLQFERMIKKEQDKVLKLLAEKFQTTPTQIKMISENKNAKYK